MHAHRFNIAMGITKAARLSSVDQMTSKIETDPGADLWPLLTGPPQRPAPCKLALLANPGFVLHQRSLGVPLREAFTNSRQISGEIF